MHGRHDSPPTTDQPLADIESDVMSTRHAVWHVAMNSLLLVLLGLVIQLWPASLGGRTTIVFVSGTSMQPTLTSEDVVVAREHAVYAVGDLVVFRVPEGEASGQYIIHRIVGGSETTGWVTRGDNRTAVDPWFLSDRDLVGRAERKAAIGPALRTAFRWVLEPVVWSIAGAVVTYVVALRYLRERDAVAREAQSSRNSKDSTA